jgi:hypothetical protein
VVADTYSITVLCSAWSTIIMPPKVIFLACPKRVAPAFERAANFWITPPA